MFCNVDKHGVSIAPMEFVHRSIESLEGRIVPAALVIRDGISQYLKRSAIHVESLQYQSNPSKLSSSAAALAFLART